MGHKILINVGGPDHPGIISQLMQILTENKTKLHDMGQSVTHGFVSLSFLVDEESQTTIKELSVLAKKMGMVLSTRLINEHTPIKYPKERYVVNCVGMNGISADFIEDVSTLFSEFD